MGLEKPDSIELILPDTFDFHFKILNLRASMYRDYCQYLFNYALTNKSLHHPKYYVKYVDEDEVKDGKRYVEVSDALHRQIRIFYSLQKEDSTLTLEDVLEKRKDD